MDEEKNKIYSSSQSSGTTTGIGSSSKGFGGSVEGSSAIGGSSSQSGKTIKETFRTGSPDDVRERVKETVAKGVAAVAGALKGFTEETQKNRLADQTREAIQQAGDTTRNVVASTTEQIEGMKEPLREAAHKVGSTVRDVGKSAKDEYRQTREGVKGSGSSSLSGSNMGSSSSMGMGGSSLGTSAYNLPTGAGGSPSTGPTMGEMPDISNTPLGKTDKELRKGGSSGNQY